MGLTDRFNKLTKQAKDSAAEHKQQVEQALQKAAVAADQRTGGQYHDQIIKAETRAEDYVENLETPTPTQPDDKTKPAAGPRRPRNAGRTPEAAHDTRARSQTRHRPA